MWTFNLFPYIYFFTRRKKTVTLEARLIDLERKLERSTRENSHNLERLEQKLDSIQNLLEKFEAKELSLNTNLY